MTNLVKELLSMLESKSSMKIEDVEDEGNDAVVIVKHTDGRKFRVKFPEDLGEPTISGDKHQQHEVQDIISVATPGVERG
jgi:hypothetical protein